MTRITTLDFPTFHRSTIGFDKMFNELNRSFANSQSNGYPPYNIVQHNDNEFTISLAVAGFDMDDLSITKDKNTLSIEGKSPKADDAEEEVNFLHKGVAARSFKREFTLADYVEVKSAELKLGMLHLQLQRQVPEELQPKKIVIQQA